MTISIGYILGHLCEFILFIYFSNTNFRPKNSYIVSSLISLCGYILLFGIGLFGKAAISILSFFIINVLLLIYCYNIKLRNAIFYSLILDTLSCIGEYMFLYLLGIKYSSTWEGVTDHIMLLMVIGGKFVYLIGIIVLKYFMKKKIIYDGETPISLTTIPILTIICLTIIMSEDINILLFLFVSTVFLIINFVTFYIHSEFNDKNRVLKSLQDELSEYKLLSEKYENTKIMRHDFHKQLDVLKNLIAADNFKAKEYMQQIQFSQRELDYAQYTDNKILNVLFAQKIKEYHKRGVEIHIHSTSPSLSFISDIDTVAIFSNMLDNAIEAAEKSSTKEIYVDLYTVNKSYSAIKIENNSDEEPIVYNGLLSTQKKNDDIHGVGIKSINNALKKYKSELTWTYDREKKFFRALVIIHIPKKINTETKIY